MRTNTSLNRRSLLAAAANASALLRIPANAQSSQSEATPVPGDSLSSQISQIVANCDSIFGVVIIGDVGQIVFEHNPDVPFLSASLYKLVLIAEILTKIETGDLALDDQVEIRDEFFILENGLDSYFDISTVGEEVTIEELLYSAGSYSSNTGAQALVSLSSVEELDARAVALGLTNTFYRLKAEEVADLYAPDSPSDVSAEYRRSLRYIQSFAADGIVNVTTPRDVARIFELLRDDELGSEVTSWRFKQVLTARVINDRLPALLPAETEVVHKTGNLPGVLHDAGIIESTAGPVVVVALAQAIVDLDLTMSIQQRIGLAAFETGLPSGG